MNMSHTTHADYQIIILSDNYFLWLGLKALISTMMAPRPDIFWSNGVSPESILRMREQVMKSSPYKHSLVFTEASRVNDIQIYLPSERVTNIYARPGTATAVKVDFDVHHAVSVQARLVNSRHQPLPMGSVVSTPRGATIVGRDGFIWLEDPPLPGELVVTTAQGTCRVALPPTQSSTSRLNLGEQPCR